MACVTVGKYTEKELIKLGESLLTCCEKPHVFHIVQWTREQKKCASWWLDLRSRHPILLGYHNRAREILGGKIVQLAFESGNTWAIQTFIPKYLDDVWDFMKEKIKVEALAKAEAAKEAMQKDPDHPYWEAFAKYMEGQKVENSPQ